MSDINAVALTISPVTLGDEDNILIGFNSGIFSQAVNLPYRGVEAARELGDQIREAIVKSAEEIALKRLSVGADN